MNAQTILQKNVVIDARGVRVVGLRFYSKDIESRRARKGIPTISLQLYCRLSAKKEGKKHDFGFLGKVMGKGNPKGRFIYAVTLRKVSRLDIGVEGDKLKRSPDRHKLTYCPDPQIERGNIANRRQN